jgi:hypothetical protein
MRFVSILFITISLFGLAACRPSSRPTPTPAITNTQRPSQADMANTVSQDRREGTERAATRSANQAEAYSTYIALALTDTPAPTNNSRIVTNTPIAEAQAIPTNTVRPSRTPEPTDTDRPTRAPQPTDTERPSRTPQPTDTEQPSRTPRPTEVDTTTYYVTGSTANVRSCSTSTTTCNVLTALSWGDDIEVIEQVEGVSVAGSTRWYRVLLNDGREGYIHGGLVSRTRPIAGSSGGGSSSNSGSSTGSTNNAGSSNNVQPTQVPQQQAQPTQPPPPPAPSGYTCDCNKTCGAMTCEEAYFQLNTCGCGARDNDNDGVPCESVCSGG